MNQGNIRFSIIVPTFNRPEQLTKICLRSLAELNYPCDQFEVIIVHDGDEKISQLEKSFGEFFNLKILAQHHAGPAVARNTAAKLARGQFLAFTDDDCAPDTNWLKFMHHATEIEPLAAIGGKTLNLLNENPYSTASQMLIDYLYYSKNQAYGRAGFVASNNMVVPAEPFHRIGGFSDAFSIGGEDLEFCHRWLNYGHSMIYFPKALIYHAHELSFNSFLRQHFIYGRGAWRYRRAVAKKNRRHIKLEQFSFYVNLLAYPITKERAKRPSSIFTLFLFICSQLAHCAGFLCEKLQDSQGMESVATTIG